MHLFFLAVAVFGVVSAEKTASECRDSFTSSLISASTQTERCTAVSDLEYCLSRTADESDNDLVILTQAKKANDCKDNKIQARITSRENKIGFEVDSDGDVVLERLKRESVSLVGLYQDVANLKNQVDAQEISFDRSLATAYNMSTQTLSALVNSALKEAQTANVEVATFKEQLKAMGDRVDGKVAILDNELADSIEQAKTYMQTEVDKVSVTDTDLRKDMSVLDGKVTDALNKLDSAFKCNLKGTLENGKCKCDDGFSGTKCEDIAVTSCYNAPKKGRYTITVAGQSRRVFCDPETYGGGWELAFNLETGLKPSLDYGASFWSEVGKTLNDNSDESVDNALRKDFKSSIFNAKKGIKEVMLVAHADSDYIAYNVYDTLAATRSKTLSELFRGATTLFTAARKYNWGNLESRMLWNNQRPQPARGDVLIDYPNPLVINKNGGWGAARNLNRLANTYTNNNYGHTFAGIGGWHEHGFGSYRTKYEAAPITSYCDTRVGYGGWNAITEGNGYCVKNSGGYDGFKWHNVDFALFVR